MDTLQAHKKDYEKIKPVEKRGKFRPLLFDGESGIPD
jgi:hypothetical protein